MQKFSFPIQSTWNFEVVSDSRHNALRLAQEMRNKIQSETLVEGVGKPDAVQLGLVQSV